MGRLQLVDLVGYDSVLWNPDPRQPTTLAYAALATSLQQYQTHVLVVDGTADTFGGNENDRGEVKRDINALLACVTADVGAVLLLHHVNKLVAGGIGRGVSGEGYSGSTAWHNSARARWYLHPERGGEDAGEHPGSLLLELQKSNLGRANRKLRFSWNHGHGLFLGEQLSPPTATDKAQRDETERQAIIQAFHGCAQANIYVPAATTGRRTAYHVLSVQKAFPKTLGTPSKNTKKQRDVFWRHMEVLRRMEMVCEASIRRSDGHRTVTLKLAGEQP